MQIVSMAIGGTIRTIRRCRGCGYNVSYMGKNPVFCSHCGRRMIERYEYISPDAVAKIVEAHYLKLETEGDNNGKA